MIRVDEVLLWPDEVASEWCKGWVPRDAVPDEADAIAQAARELDEDPATLRVVPVLMREESEVEARINGHEFPYTVECTRRARRSEPYWRVEHGGDPAVTAAQIPSFNPSSKSA